jgi:outer membrane protein
MKKGCLIGAALMLSMIIRPASPAAAEYRLAYVDLQKALNLCKAGQDAKEKFSKKVEKAEQSLSGRQEELKKLQEVLEKQGSMLNEAALKEKKKDYEAKLRDFKRLYDESQDELKAQDNEAVKEILSELVKITQSYGKEKGFTFVFEKSESALLFADETTEITDEIIKRYDAAFAQGGKAATP